MGNRALRKKLAQVIREVGWDAKLYYGNKHQAWRYLRAYTMREIIHLLSFKKGDLAHDCDGFNHVVKEPMLSYHRWHGQTLVPQISQLEFEDGRYSCGCPGGPMPACSREEIERYFTMTDEQVKERKTAGWWSQRDEKIHEALRSGKHICDERGVLLKEFADADASVFTFSSVSS